MSKQQALPKDLDMYWTRFVGRDELEHGRTFVHGTSRMNITDADLAAFVDPPDAALVLGFRSLDPGDPFEKSFPVWMATLRRRDEEDAIVESVQRVFVQLVDDESLLRMMRAVYRRAHSLGYRKLWFAAGLFREPLLAPAVKRIVDVVKRPISVVPTTGMASIDLVPLA
jgi:hypothetical protein